MSKHEYILPEVMLSLAKWQLVEDCYGGQDEIDKRGETYLPNPAPSKDDPKEREARYNDYRRRAVYYNVVRRTAKGMAGLIFAKYPALELPAQLKELEVDVDGGGISFVQQARRVVLSVLKKGRCGLLADFPVTDGAMTREQTRDNNLRPIITVYNPESIINWRVERIGNSRKLTLLVLKEQYSIGDDGFKHSYSDQYMVFRLVNGQATSQFIRKVEGDWFYSDELVIKGANGTPFNEIPFTFVGSDDNDETIDDAPLYDIAKISIAHYRNSADYEESIFIAGQPTLVVAGITESWNDKVLSKNPIRLGSRSAVLLPVGGSADLLQPDANGIQAEAMAMKEQQMVSLGAKIIEPAEVTKTATQVSGEQAEDTSVLSTIANNTSDAYARVLNWCGLYAGTTQECKVTLNTRFNTNKMTAQERQQLIAEWQAGAISFPEMRANLYEDEVAKIEDHIKAKEQIDEYSIDNLTGDDDV